MSRLTYSSPIYGAQQPQVLVKIHDAQNILLASAELTSIVVAAAGRAVRALLLQGVIEIMLTINAVTAEIQYILYSGRIRRRLEKFHITVDLYSREYQRADASNYGYIFKQVWLNRIEEEFFRQMADLE